MLKRFYKLFLSVFFTIFFVFCFSILFNRPVFASGVSVNINTEYLINTSEYTDVKYVETVTNNTPASALFLNREVEFPFYSIFKYSDPSTSEKINSYQINSLKVFVNKRAVKFKTKKDADGYKILFNPNVSVYFREKVEIKLEYKSIEVFQKKGRVIRIDIPESPSVVTSEGGSVIKYSTNVKINNKLGKISYTTAELKTEGDYSVLNLSTKGDSKKIHRIIIGDEQLWKFNYVLPIIPFQNKFANLIKYELLLPTDDPTLNQKVYYSNFTPEPNEITQTENGNLIATYYISRLIKEIKIEGYAYQKIPPEIFGNYPNFQFDSKRYTSSQEYWEVNDELIQTTSKSIVSTNDDLDIIKSVYNFVVSKVNYDDLKLGINNIRKGAVYTLKYGSGVCMEFSDLLITLLRSKNVPSRAVFGLGYSRTNSEDSAEYHQWVQAYVKDKGWVSIDPTWGESTQTYIGPDLDHFTWYLTSFDLNSTEAVFIKGIATDTLIFPEDNEKYFLPTITLSPQEGEVNYLVFPTIEKLKQKYVLETKDKFIFELKTYVDYLTAIVIIGVSLLTLVVLTVITLIRKLIKKIKG